MNNKNINKSNHPVIFTKKINDLGNTKIIPLNNPNDLGHVRFFPPATKEWFNSIYAYSSNYTKLLPSADKTLMRLIKSYFNLYNPKEENLNSKPLRLRFKRLSVKKIFVSRAELKHTSSKILITLYVYNAEKRFLANKIKTLGEIFFPKLLTNEKLAKLSPHQLKNIENRELLSLRDKLRDIDQKNLSLMSQVEMEKQLILDNNLSAMQEVKEMNIHNNQIYSLLLKKALEEELMLMTYYKHLLDFNKAKFEDSYLLKLADIVSKIYDKKVEFNIVNLKHLHLNSDLLMDIIATKLKNRDTGLLRVLKKSLKLFSVPQTNSIDLATEKLLENKIKSIKLNSLSSDNNKDSLDQLLVNNLVTTNATPSNSLVLSKQEDTSNVDNIVLNSIKDKAIGGMRLEAKGRLTRRFTASRSVFKVKWKGSLKNIDSSYKGLSTVMLRGHAKSNVQYTMINSKTRNGAFGIKGWVSGK